MSSPIGKSEIETSRDLTLTCDVILRVCIDSLCSLTQELLPSLTKTFVFRFSIQPCLSVAEQRQILNVQFPLTISFLFPLNQTEVSYNWPEQKLLNSFVRLLRRNVIRLAVARNLFVKKGSLFCSYSRWLSGVTWNKICKTRKQWWLQPVGEQTLCLPSIFSGTLLDKKVENGSAIWKMCPVDLWFCSYSKNMFLETDGEYRRVFGSNLWLPLPQAKELWNQAAIQVCASASWREACPRVTAEHWKRWAVSAFVARASQERTKA